LGREGKPGGKFGAPENPGRRVGIDPTDVWRGGAESGGGEV